MLDGVTKTSCELQCVWYDIAQHLITSDPQNTLYSLQYSFLIKLLVQEGKIEEIAAYDSLEALRTLHSHQAPYLYHQLDTLLYLEVLIGYIRSIVSFPQETPL